ncbi:hypothetical protein BJ742DRAFT_814994 [Cladochytrium replicatum]|nr:hypothetical protein BJ742DRAFT_814994 [Cladochytrium replicatum]
MDSVSVSDSPQKVQPQPTAEFEEAAEDFIALNFSENDDEDDTPGRFPFSRVPQVSPPPENSRKRSRDQREKEDRRLKQRGGKKGREGADKGVIRDVDPLERVPLPPWVPEDCIYSSDMVKMLNQEIDDYVAYMAPTPAEVYMRNDLINRIRDIVLNVFYNAEMHVFGSFDTGVFLPTSDLDLVVLTNIQKGSVQSALYKLAQNLRNRMQLESLTVIAKARVPIIKLVDKLTGYNVDISFNIESGLDSAAIMKSFLADQLVGSALRSILIVMKQFLTCRGLNEVFSGGLGSYSLILLVFSFLKLHPMIQTQQIAPGENLGVLLLEFLELYGRNLNSEVVGIATHLDYGSWYFDKRTKSLNRFATGKDNVISIQDPQDNENDVAKGSRQWWLIRNEFTRAFHRVTGVMNTFYLRHTNYVRGSESYSTSASSSSSTRLRRDRAPEKPVTLLGLILTVSKDIVDFRERVQSVYEEQMYMNESGLPMTNGSSKSVPSVTKGGGKNVFRTKNGGDESKRKGRDDNKERGRKEGRSMGVNGKEVVFVEHNSDDEGSRRFFGQELCGDMPKRLVAEDLIGGDGEVIESGLMMNFAADGRKDDQPSDEDERGAKRRKVEVGEGTHESAGEDGGDPVAFYGLRGDVL